MHNLYNVEQSEDGLTYAFTTRYDIKYHLALTVYHLGDISAFSLSFYPDTTPTHIDYGIKNTVIKIIGDLLNKDSSVIFYICDSGDNREDQRHDVFEYWYQKTANHFYYISKFNYCFESENGYNINASILYNNQNPLGDLIIEEFQKSLDF